MSWRSRLCASRTPKQFPSSKMRSAPVPPPLRKGSLGNRPSHGNGTLPLRNHLQETHHPHELPQRNQGLLHETRPGRKNRRRGGYPRAKNRRNNRGISEGASPGRLDSKMRGNRTGSQERLVVSGFEALRNGASFWIRTGI